MNRPVSGSYCSAATDGPPDEWNALGATAGSTAPGGGPVGVTPMGGAGGTSADGSTSIGDGLSAGGGSSVGGGAEAGGGTSAGDAPGTGAAGRVPGSAGIGVPSRGP